MVFDFVKYSDILKVKKRAREKSLNEKYLGNEGIIYYITVKMRYSMLSCRLVHTDNRSTVHVKVPLFIDNEIVIILFLLFLLLVILASSSHRFDRVNVIRRQIQLVETKENMWDRGNLWGTEANYGDQKQTLGDRGKQ